jgi:hypothetical protein
MKFFKMKFSWSSYLVSEMSFTAAFFQLTGIAVA